LVAVTCGPVLVPLTKGRKRYYQARLGTSSPACLETFSNILTLPNE
jgi:hypothetical protein